MTKIATSLVLLAIVFSHAMTIAAAVDGTVFDDGAARRVQAGRSIMDAIPTPPIELAGATLGLTRDQSKLLVTAHTVGKSIGKSETIQAMLLAETLAGKSGVIGDDGRSLGELQVQREAAMSVVARHPELGVSQDWPAVKLRLMEDSDFAIRIGALYLEDLYQDYAQVKDRNKRLKAAVLCYNAGPDNVRIGRDPQGYLQTVERFRAQIVKPFNAMLGLRG